MISLDEQLVGLSDVPGMLPSIGGKRVHRATVYRWVQRGIRGHRLEALCVGGRRVTSRQALDRFFQALTGEPYELEEREPERSATDARRLADRYGL